MTVAGLPEHADSNTGYQNGVQMKRMTLGLLLGSATVALLLLRVCPAGEVLAQDTQRAGLVVRFYDGSVFSECIEFSQPDISGCEVLNLSSLSVVYGGYGTYGEAVCTINGVGCPASNCFCECGGVDCEYWAYYHLGGAKWNYSTAGCSSHFVEAGDVEGWAWGAGTVGATSEVQPPVMTFEELCAPPTPPIVDLYAEPDNVVAGQCSTVHWSVENAGVVTLNGEGVRPTDARYVCPQNTQTFELRVFNDSGEYSYEVTVRVTQPSPTPRATATPTRAPTATRQPPAAPPPAATNSPRAPVLSPSPSPTVVPSTTPTSGATLLAMVATPSATPPDEEPTVVLQGSGDSEHPLAMPPPSTTGEESVGLQRILLLLGVGAGTVGFGAIAFVIMLMLLMVIYFRARTHF
ncbi:MAG TPA: hypothetical protein VM075_04030 [Anaerolineae bacterium]|nr:hypothetical protein [Anaerolineae bacterium]